MKCCKCGEPGPIQVLNPDTRKHDQYCDDCYNARRDASFERYRAAEADQTVCPKCGEVIKKP